MMEHLYPLTPKHKPSLKIISQIRDWASMMLFVVALYTIVNLVSVRFVVDGISMEPTFETGEFLLISRMNYLFGEPQRGDIVVFHSPTNPKEDFIKRVVGLPGETIEIRDRRIYIDGTQLDEPYLVDACSEAMCQTSIWQVGQDEIFVLGDNRNFSSDSRSFGAIKQSLIVGEAIIRYYPLREQFWIHQIGVN